jgi:non-specific serine/threonine protein kinase/serine/threonine-protein kinase
MNRERWQQVKQLLAEAIAINDAERSAFLDIACRGDAELRREVESLLSSHHEASTGFLNEPVVKISGTVAAAAAPARERRLGAYQVAEEIGHGGMGEVYRALRADGQYRKEVAIKMVRGGFVPGSLAERFRNERQILASLDHPNIARLLDGGATEDGVPYLVMELIQGVPIDQYCDQHGLTVTERLRLFRQVCGAVQYAHQRLVIHRDIKPGNILVTGDGVPKLLDFGLAKLLDPSLDAETTMMRAMTPEYASPEQIRGEVITTATDVYSLGVVLYRLLIGRSPYAGDTSTPHGLARAICDDDPARPSSVVFKSEKNQSGTPSTTASISSRREDSPVKLRKRLAGDLDTVVLMALRKDAAQRYASVEQFSEDIRRHLDNIPVLARKDALGYRTAKFIRRHKAGVAAACVIVALIAGSMAMIVRAERRAQAQQALAERRFNDVRKLAHSLIYEIHDSIRTLPGATGPRQLIVQRAQEYLDSLSADSKSDVGLKRELAAAYERLANVQGDTSDANVGDSKGAVENYRRAAHLLEAVTAAAPQDGDGRRELAQVYLALANTDRSASAKGLLDQAQALLEPLAAANPEDPRNHWALAKAAELWGYFYVRSGEWKEAQASYERSLGLYSHLVAIDPGNQEYQVGLAYAHKHLGALLIHQKQPQPALEHYRAALSIDEAQLKADPQNVSRRYGITSTYSDTGYILGMQGDVEGALTYYRKVLAIRKALADADSKDSRARSGLASTYGYIGFLLQRQGRFHESLAAYQEALTIREALAGNDTANDNRRLDVAKVQEAIAEAYEKMAFRPGVSGKQRADFCSRAELFVHRALPVLRQQKEKLVANEIDDLTGGEKTAERCSPKTAGLKTTGPEVTKAHVP